MIESGDKKAKELYEKFHLMMPPFGSISEKELDGLLAYLNTKTDTAVKSTKENPNALKDPIAAHMEMTSLVLGLQEITQIPFSSNDSILHTRIAKLDFQPNTQHLFVSDLRGKMFMIENGKPVLYFDMEKMEPKFINQPGMATGFGSFAFHPEFAKNGLFYTTHTEPPHTKPVDFDYGDSIKATLQWVLTEWKTDSPGSVPFTGKNRELLRINMVTGIHGAQEITFNPNSKPGDKDYGLLYMGIGDGGSVEEGFPSVPHGRNKIWGSVIRIDPAGKNSGNGQYGIPADNPFVALSDPKTVKEIYAFGFRNPHRITFTKAGQMLVSNIGQANIESVNMILPGHDYGWPVREGTFMTDPLTDMTKVFPLPANDSFFHYTYPVVQYDHGEGNAVSGGYEYTGTKIPALKGKYVFGDVANGRLFYVETADLKIGHQSPIKEWKIAVNGQVKELKELCKSNHVDLRFGKDINGELYILTKPDGRVYKVIPSTSK